MSLAGVQRSIRRARTVRRVTVAAIVLNAVLFAANIVTGSPLVFVNLFLFGAFAVLIAVPTRVLSIMRERERELARPCRVMTAEDWRQLREMETGLGWEPSEMPPAALFPVPGPCACPPDACAPVEVRTYAVGSPVIRYCGACGKRIREDEGDQP